MLFKIPRDVVNTTDKAVIREVLGSRASRKWGRKITSLSKFNRFSAGLDPEKVVKSLNSQETKRKLILKTLKNNPRWITKNYEFAKAIFENIKNDNTPDGKSLREEIQRLQGKKLKSTLLWGRKSNVIALIDKVCHLDYIGRNGATPLVIAAKEGHIEVVKALIEKGANLNLADNRGNTPLIYAAFKGHTEIVKVLIEKGANFNHADNWGNTALTNAAFKGHTKIIKILIEKGANLNLADNRGNTALIFAAEKGRTGTVKTLIEKGANLNLANNWGNTALMEAVICGCTEVVKTLIEKGADPNLANSQGKTALMYAVETGRTKIVMALIKGGADLNLANITGRTALRFALFNQHTKTANVLMDNDNDCQPLLQPKDPNYTVRRKIYKRKWGKNVKVFTQLLENKQLNDLSPKKIKVVDRAGNSLLMYAVSNKLNERVKELLQIGVDISHKNKIGHTALTLAAKAGNWRVAKLVLKAIQIESEKDRKSFSEELNTALAFSLANRHIDFAQKLTLYLQ